jgi:enamine deaminase RidA (YjgF/YER057c/UK114 family)
MIDGISPMTGDPTIAIKRINPRGLGTPPGYSQVVDVSARRLIFIAGQTALNQDGELIGKNDFSAGLP